MLTDEEKRKLKNDKERERWKKARDAKLIAKGIDPASRPISENGTRGKAISDCKRDLPPEIKYQREDESDEEFHKRYQSEVKKRYYARNQERLRAEKRQKYIDNHDHIIKVRSDWANNNPDKVKSQQKRYFDKNREARIEKIIQWKEENIERYTEAKKQWYKDNPHLNAFYSSKWRKECRKATPPWADTQKILAIYEESTSKTKESGISHHVDHIVPVQGKHVTGLHIHQNMRIIPASENVKKRARLDEKLVIQLMKRDWQSL